MDKLSNAQIQEMRAKAQQIDVSLHVGKNGVTPATVEELSAQLKKRKLVKVRLLPAATEGGAHDQDQAKALAEATHSTLVEVRGHTAVYFRP
jgi:RNA-binding protein